MATPALRRNAQSAAQRLTSSLVRHPPSSLSLAAAAASASDVIPCTTAACVLLPLNHEGRPLWHPASALSEPGICRPSTLSEHGIRWPCPHFTHSWAGSLGSRHDPFTFSARSLLVVPRCLSTSETLATLHSVGPWPAPSAAIPSENGRLPLVPSFSQSRSFFASPQARDAAGKAAQPEDRAKTQGSSLEKADGATGTDASEQKGEGGEEGGEEQAEEEKPRGSFFWQSLKWGFGFSVFATVGACAYVTYVYDNETVRGWVKEARKALNEKYPEISQETKQRDGVSSVLMSPQQWPAAAQLALIDLGQTYVDLRDDAEESLHKFTSPSSDRLLPDLLPQERHVYTLVLDVEGTLVVHEWRRDRGWRTFKRPGVDAFLERMAQFYEVVVFDDQLGLESDPLLDKLDPNHRIRFRLHRDSTQYTKGKYIKDLSKLNRDPQRVIYITANQDSVMQKENMVLLQPWDVETAQDTALLDLLPFLECVSRQRPPDTRAVLLSYEGQDIPVAFKERAKEYNKHLQERKQTSWFRVR